MTDTTVNQHADDAPLPTAPGTVIDVVTRDDEGDLQVERFVRLDENSAIDADIVWLSLYDRQVWSITVDDAYDWTLVALPIADLPKVVA